jgi:hypothetical protein
MTSRQRLFAGVSGAAIAVALLAAPGGAQTTNERKPEVESGSLQERINTDPAAEGMSASCQRLLDSAGDADRIGMSEDDLRWFAGEDFEEDCKVAADAIAQASAGKGGNSRANETDGSGEQAADVSMNNSGGADQDGVGGHDDSGLSAMGGDMPYDASGGGDERVTDTGGEDQGIASTRAASNESSQRNGAEGDASGGAMAASGGKGDANQATKAAQDSGGGKSARSTEGRNMAAQGGSTGGGSEGRSGESAAAGAVMANSVAPSAQGGGGSDLQSDANGEIRIELDLSGATIVLPEGAPGADSLDGAERRVAVTITGTPEVSVRRADNGGATATGGESSQSKAQAQSGGDSGQSGATAGGMMAATGGGMAAGGRSGAGDDGVSRGADAAMSDDKANGDGDQTRQGGDAMASSTGGGQAGGGQSGDAMSGDTTQKSAATSQSSAQGGDSDESALIAARQAHNKATTDGGAMGGDGRNQNAGMAGSTGQQQADATPDNSGPYGETPGEALVNDVAGLLGMGDSEQEANRGQGDAQVAPASNVAASEVAVSSLKGDAIRSRDGDKLGEIRAVVSGDQGPLLIVRTEGMILGFGSRDVEVPVSAVSLTNDGVVVDDRLAEELDAMKKAQSYRSRSLGDDDRLQINRQQ